MNGNATYCTGSWTVHITDDNGNDIDVTGDNNDNEFVVLGFRHARHWNTRPTAGTSADVSRALAEAKAAATAWLNARPDYR
jgi:hypothetical protein